MADPHRITSIIAKTILDCYNRVSEANMDPELARSTAKCIVEMLADAELEIVPRTKD